jgi:hypothetical protein
MRVATTRLARVIARLGYCAPLCEFAHHPLELKFCRRMHFPSSGSKEDNQMAARIVKTDDQNH